MKIENFNITDDPNELFKTLSRVIEDDTLYDLTICFANGMKKNPVQIPGAILKSVFVQMMTNQCVAVVSSSFGLTCPIVNINEIYWTLSKETENSEEGESDEVKESLN